MTIRIGNAQGFWGDSMNASSRLIAQQPNLDYLTMDYLAEVSLSILALQRDKNPQLGYAQDFIEELRSLIPLWKQGAAFKVVVNAGGLNPEGCAKAAKRLLQESGLGGMKIGVVSGDDVMLLIHKGTPCNHLDTREPINKIKGSLISANAYVGSRPIAEALKQGASIVITGRTADPSLAVACCAAHFNWKWDDWDKIAAATVAGHLIECGTQVTGGISTNWLDIPDPAHIGFPVIEMEADGSFIVTKPDHTGGCVTEQTVKEQLLYEIGDPNAYLSPDATVSFLGLKLKHDGEDRIKVTGAKGRAPPSSYKVSATYRCGYMSEGTLTFFGRDVREKAQRCGEIVLERVRNAGYNLERTNIECIGTGDVVPGVSQNSAPAMECVLRVAVADSRKEAVESFSKEMAPLITSGAQGITGYSAGRPKVRQVFGFWPCLIDTKLVHPKVEILEVGA